MSVLNFNNITKSKTTRWGAIGAALQILATAFSGGVVGIPVIVSAVSTLLIGLFAGDHDGPTTPPAPPAEPEKKQ